MIETVAWTEAGVELLDQRYLPGRGDILRLRTPEEVADAIRPMAGRGAPAIGVTAAQGLALGARQAAAGPPAAFRARFDALCALFAATRPTAVNLFWAIERMKGRLAEEERRGAAPAAIAAALVTEAARIKDEDVAACRAMGRFG